MTKCKVCGRDLVYSGRSFCSRECFYRFPRKHSQTTKDKIRMSNTGKDNSSRSEAISLSLSQREFTSEERERLLNTSIAYPWVSNENALIALSGIENTFGKVLAARKEDVKKILQRDRGSKIPKFMLSVKIQYWDLAKIEEFKKDVGRLLDKDENYFDRVYGVSENSSTFKKITRLWCGGCRIQRSIPRTELFVYRELTKLGCSFLREVPICHGKWRVDFLVENKVIEVNGDYWHANPRVYRDDDLSETQKEGRRRDSFKEAFISRHYDGLLVIWEKDINERPSSVRLMISGFLGRE